MKIVQTLWIPEGPTPIAFGAGWLSPEYHWMSWALSCLLLRQQYADVELYTSETGYELLINQFKLPYTRARDLKLAEEARPENYLRQRIRL